MQICGLGVAEFGILPKGPLLAFLLVQNGGYLVAFTAAARRSARWRRASASSRGPNDVARSRPRAPAHCRLARAGRARPASASLTALFSRDHRGLHDRFAGTRVVRAAEPAGSQTDLDVLRLALAVATALGVGYMPFAPGTFGSAAGLLLWCAAARHRPVVQAVAIVACSWSARGAAASPSGISAATDPGQVVIDEVMGMLITLFLESRRLGRRAVGRFSCFASADIIKPYPANRLERLHGGVGVMADDAMAAVYANLALRRCIWSSGHRVIWSLPWSMPFQ